MASTINNKAGKATTVAAKEPIHALGHRISEKEICTICFEDCKDKCYVNSCLHAFCFRCISKWCKITAKCPMCRSRISKIFRNVLSISHYVVYTVRCECILKRILVNGEERTVSRCYILVFRNNQERRRLRRRIQRQYQRRQ